ncbi:MAG: hypothetical protein K0Q95_2583 [Bacteroidota bacterium]|jgi:hypothetical protein|nr:hypothetical protein [Bacteroidota bacterium]
MPSRPEGIFFNGKKIVSLNRKSIYDHKSKIQRGTTGGNA